MLNENKSNTKSGNNNLRVLSHLWVWQSEKDTKIVEALIQVVHLKYPGVHCKFPTEKTIPQEHFLACPRFDFSDDPHRCQIGPLSAAAAASEEFHGATLSQQSARVSVWHFLMAPLALLCRESPRVPRSILWENNLFGTTGRNPQPEAGKSTCSLTGNEMVFHSVGVTMLPSFIPGDWSIDSVRRRSLERYGETSQQHWGANSWKPGMDKRFCPVGCSHSIRKQGSYL